jgi:hypothetical protein
MALSTAERFGVGMGVAFLSANLLAGCSSAPQEQVTPTPEATTIAPDIDEKRVKTVGGVIIGIYEGDASQQYPAYSTPKGSEETGSYARGEKVDIVCSAAKRYLLYRPDEWIDTKAVKVSGKVKVPKCSATQIPEERSSEPAPTPTHNPEDNPEPNSGTDPESWSPPPTETLPTSNCKVTLVYSPATKQYVPTVKCS